MNCITTVLLTAIGSFSGASAIESYKTMGVRVIGVDLNPKSVIPESRLVDSFYQVCPAIQESNYLKELLQICSFEKVNYVIPLTDVEIDILDRNREIFLSENIFLCFFESCNIKKCRNKFVVSEMNHPLLGKINTLCLNKIDKIEWNLFPAILKPLNGRSSEGLFKISNKKDLNFYINKIDVSNYLIQEFINGEIITVDIIRQASNGIMHCFPRIERKRTGNGAGLSITTIYDERIVQICKFISESMCINGVINVELIKNNDYFFLIDINPRFSAGIAFTKIAGYDLAINHLRCFLGHEIDPYSFEKNLNICKYYSEVKMV